MLHNDFFDQDAQELARALLGKVLCVKRENIWLKVMIVETEAYYLADKASHASLGFTEKRRALFMPPGTIYMYYARGKDSLNISAQGEGNAVLIKAGIPYQADSEALRLMQNENLRPIEKCCAGQTLLCRALGLRVQEWDKKNFDPERFYCEDVQYYPEKIIQTTRLGIPAHRDPHLLYRFIDYRYANSGTSNPLRKRNWKLNRDYFIHSRSAKNTAVSPPRLDHGVDRGIRSDFEFSVDPAVNPQKDVFF